MTLLPLIQPGSVRGFASARSSVAPLPGLLSLAQNVRLDDGIPEARGGDASAVTIAGSGTVRGTYGCKIDGTDSLFAAIGDGSKVTVYKSTDGGANWSSITPSSGAFGDTRLTDSATTPVFFTVVRDRPENSDDAYDLLVIQNGTDSPRIYGKARDPLSPFGHNTFGTAVLTQPATMANNANLFCKPTFFREYVFSGVTITNDDDTELDVDLVSGALEVDILTGYTTTTKSKLIFGSPLIFSDSSQLVMMVEHPTDTDTWKEKVVLELVDGGGNFVTVYNPTTDLGTASVVAVDGSTDTVLIAYQLPTFAAPFDADDVDGIRISFTEDLGTEQMHIYAIAASGKIPGSTQFAVAYHADDTRAIGPSTIITARKNGAFGGFVLPESSLVKYDFVIGVTNPSQAQVDAGITSVYIYSKESGQSDYYWLAAAGVSNWDGATWDTSSGDPGAGRTLNVSVAANLVQNTAFPRPDEATVTLPTGKAMEMVNGRLFVLQDGRYWFSDFERPFRFRRAVAFSGLDPYPWSGGSVGMDGQTLMQIVPVGTFAGSPEVPGSPIGGAATLFLLTSANLYSVSGVFPEQLSRPISVAPHGTASPFSVARSKGGFFWLDTEGNVRFFGQGGLRNLSLGRVDDLTKAIPTTRRVWVSGACRAERYHMAYTAEGGTTNLKVLCWSELLQEWESLDTVAADTVFLLPVIGSNRLKLMGFAGATVYEFNQPGQGTVAVTLTTPEVSGKLQSKVTCNQALILCDQVDSGSVGIARYFPCESASAVSSTISIDESTPRSWRWTPEGVGGEGGSFYVSLTSTAPAGWKLYNLLVESNAVDAGFGNR